MQVQDGGSHYLRSPEEASPPSLERRHWMANQIPSDCPAGIVFVTTTTVDVTVYVTPTPEPEPMEPHVTTIVVDVTTTEPCDDGTSMTTVVRNMTMTRTIVRDITTTEPCPEDETTPAMGMNQTQVHTTMPPHETGGHTITKEFNITTTEPCDTDSSSMPAMTPAYHNTTTMMHNQPSSMQGEGGHTTTKEFNMTVTEPCDTDSTSMPAMTPGKHNSTSTMGHASSMPHRSSSMPMSTPASSGHNSTTPVKHMSPPTATPTLPYCDELDNSTTVSTVTKPMTTTICVIDTSMTPVTMGTTNMPSKTHAAPRPTKTVCVHDGPIGSPSNGTAYCGIHGKPAGTYFIAEFIENKPGVAVTEEGCYQFCDVSFISSTQGLHISFHISYTNIHLQSVMEATKGCQSYRFYKNELGAPRCALYGRSVAASVDDLDKNQPDVWYDLACGSPTDEKWHKNMPATHGKRQTARRF